jgi:hypothetical protein
MRIGMSVEANIIFREKASALVVPAEAVAGNAVQVVVNDRIERVPVTVGIRGSRNVEIVGDVSRGMAVLSPARIDLADGTKVRIENSQANNQANKQASPAAGAPTDAAPDQDTASPPPAPVATAATEPDNAVISAAISAHIDSVVNDARRNVGKYSASR